MLYTRLFALLILVLTIEQSRQINVGSIFGFGRNIDSNKNNNVIDNETNNENNPVPTKISTVEQILKTLLIPVEALGNAKKVIGKGVNEIISKIPVKIDPTQDDFNTTNLKYGQVLNLVSDKFKAIYPGNTIKKEDIYI